MTPDDAIAPPRILVINHDGSILTLLCAILRRNGFHPHPCLAANRSIALIEQVAPDVLLLDYLGDADGSGWDFVLQVRQRPATHHLPMVLTVLAESDLVPLRYDLDLMNVAVVIKPFPAALLVAAVNKQAQQTQPGQER